MKAKLGYFLILVGGICLTGLRIWNYIIGIDPKTGVAMQKGWLYFLPFGMVLVMGLATFFFFRTADFPSGSPFAGKRHITLGVCLLIAGLSCLEYAAPLTRVLGTSPGSKEWIGALLNLCLVVLGATGFVWSGIHQFQTRRQSLPWVVGLFPLPLLIWRLLARYAAHFSVENSAEFPWEILMLAAALPCFFQMAKVLTGTADQKTLRTCARTAAIYLFTICASALMRQILLWGGWFPIHADNTPSYADWIFLLPVAVYLGTLVYSKTDTEPEILVHPHTPDTVCFDADGLPLFGDIASPADPLCHTDKSAPATVSVMTDAPKIPDTDVPEEEPDYVSMEHRTLSDLVNTVYAKVPQNITQPPEILGKAPSDPEKPAQADTDTSGKQTLLFP